MQTICVTEMCVFVAHIAMCVVAHIAMCATEICVSVTHIATCDASKMYLLFQVLS
jgi:hypothetical protein